MFELGDRVEVFLAAHPGEHTVDAIAKGISARRVLVSDVLFEDGRFSSREVPARRNKARVWQLAARAAATPGRASSGIRLGRRQSQNARLMEILRDGRWHTSQELNRKVPCRVNSRTSELRKRGERAGTFTIEHEQDGAGFGPEFHRYRLVSLLEQRPASVAALAIPCHTRSCVPDPPTLRANLAVAVDSRSSNGDTDLSEAA